MGGVTVNFYFNILSKSQEFGQGHPNESRWWKACLAGSPSFPAHSLCWWGWANTLWNMGLFLLSTSGVCRETVRSWASIDFSSMIQTHLNDLNMLTLQGDRCDKNQVWVFEKSQVWVFEKSQTHNPMTRVLLSPANVTSIHLWVLHSIFFYFKSLTFTFLLYPGTIFHFSLFKIFIPFNCSKMCFPS